MKRNFKTLLYLIAIFVLFQFYLFEKNSLSGNVKKAKQNLLQTFCVVAPVFNPASYQSRYELFRKFERHIQSFGVQLITVELAIGNQTFQVTNSRNPNHIQLRSDDVFWYKENLINIGIRRAPKECEYIAWIDVEVEFTDQDWVFKSIDALQRYKVIQPFDEIAILDADSKPIEARKSFAKCYVDNVSYKDPPFMRELYDKYKIAWNESENHFCASGFASVARKSVLLQTGGLYDKGLVGAGDYITIQSFLGRMDSHNSAMILREFLNDVLEWQNVVSKIIDGSFGYVSGALRHSWHGSKKDRGYGARIKIFVNRELPYNPKDHVYYDQQGLLHFQPEVRDHFISKISEFFYNRKEDSKDI